MRMVQGLLVHWVGGVGSTCEDKVFFSRVALVAVETFGQPEGSWRREPQIRRLALSLGKRGRVSSRRRRSCLNGVQRKKRKLRNSV